MTSVVYICANVMAFEIGLPFHFWLLLSHGYSVLFHTPSVVCWLKFQNWNWKDLVSTPHDTHFQSDPSLQGCHEDEARSEPCTVL